MGTVNCRGVMWNLLHPNIQNKTNDNGSSIVFGTHSYAAAPYVRHIFTHTHKDPPWVRHIFTHTHKDPHQIKFDTRSSVKKEPNMMISLNHFLLPQILHHHTKSYAGKAIFLPFYVIISRIHKNLNACHANLSQHGFTIYCMMISCFPSVKTSIFTLHIHNHFRCNSVQTLPQCRRTTVEVAQSP